MEAEFLYISAIVCAGRVCLAFLREWEGEFSRHADGTEGMDTGECSTIGFSRHISALLLLKCTKEQGHMGSTEMGAVIQGVSGCGICFFYLYTCLYNLFDFF